MGNLGIYTPTRIALRFDDFFANKKAVPVTVLVLMAW